MQKDRGITPRSKFFGKLKSYINKETQLLR